MKRIIFAIVLILNASLAYCDEIRVPFSCYPTDLQDDFADKGKKLDLSANDRTPDSWGFIESKGSYFIIYTYKSATSEDFNLITQIVFKGGACFENDSPKPNKQS